MESIPASKPIRLRRPRPTGVIAMALAGAFIVWGVVDRAGGTDARTTTTVTFHNSTKSAKAVTPFGPVVVSAAGLRDRVAALGHPIYWAGAAQGSRYELTLTDRGDVLVRYVPPGVEAGDKRPLRTVATYPVDNAFAVTWGIAQEQGAVSRKLADGALTVYRPSRPTSVYLAYLNSDNLQIEVYDPAAVEARNLANSGRIRPIR